MHDSPKAYIAARVAQELQDGDIVNLGIGLPTMVPSFLPDGVSVILQSENGMIGAGFSPDEAQWSPYVVDAGGKPAAVLSGGCFIDSATSFGLIRGGHIDCTILGALEVDAQGNLSNWIIPGKKVPGMGGAMDLVIGARRVIVAMEHTARGKPKILRQCRLPLTAVGCVDLIVTEMAVFEVTGSGLVLCEINPDVTMEQLSAATDAFFVVSPQLKAMNS